MPWDDMMPCHQELVGRWRDYKAPRDRSWSGELEYRDTIAWRRGGAGALDYTSAGAVAGALEDARHAVIHRGGWRHELRAFWKRVRAWDLRELEGDIRLAGDNPVPYAARIGVQSRVHVDDDPAYFVELTPEQCRRIMAQIRGAKRVDGYKPCEYDDDTASRAEAARRWAAA